VLIVDDNDVNRRILSEHVRRWGMTATLAVSGQSAIEALTTAAAALRPFELVLLDVDMPAMDGFGVAAEIKKRPELTGAAIVLLTSSGEFGDLARAAGLGIAAYLTKPVYPASLLAAIERALGSKLSDAAPPAAPLRAGAMAMADGGASARILLVEDNIVNQRVAAGLLGRRGHHVTIAENGRVALARLDHESFDLVLMDLQMPVMDGVEATAAIRLRERGTGLHVRIVAMTAHAMNSDRERCLAVGMDGYLAKPVDPQRLFAVVEQNDNGSGGILTAVPGPATFDESALLKRLSGDRSLMVDVIRVFLEDLPARLAAIQGAVARRHAPELRAAAHELKGAAANLSAGGLFDAASALERAGAESHLDAAVGAWHGLSVEARMLTDALNRYAASGEESHPCAS
jgi:CheY-like chemotaxis protein